MPHDAWGRHDARAATMPRRAPRHDARGCSDDLGRIRLSSADFGEFGLVLQTVGRVRRIRFNLILQTVGRVRQSSAGCRQSSADIVIRLSNSVLRSSIIVIRSSKFGFCDHRLSEFGFSVFRHLQLGQRTARQELRRLPPGDHRGLVLVRSEQYRRQPSHPRWQLRGAGDNAAQYVSGGVGSLIGERKYSHFEQVLESSPPICSARPRKNKPVPEFGWRGWARHRW